MGHMRRLYPLTFFNILNSKKKIISVFSSGQQLGPINMILFVLDGVFRVGVGREGEGRGVGVIKLCFATYGRPTLLHVETSC